MTVWNETQRYGPPGFLILGCATTATIAAVYATRELIWGAALPAWDVTVPAFWPLLGAVLVAALVLLALPRYGRGAAVVALVCAAQLIGGGIVAAHDWFRFVDPAVLPVVTPLTVLLVMAMTVVCGVALLLLWHPAVAWRPRHPGWLVAGALVATVPPVGVGFLSDFSNMTLLGQIALTWSLPWGACIAAGAWLAKPLRRLAAVTVAAAPLLTVVLLTCPLLPHD